MFHRCKMQRICALTAILTLLGLVAAQIANPPIAYAASYTVTIYPSEQFQTIQGWGTSLAWWANIVGGWSNSQRTALADALYDPNKGIGLNVVRYNFGADGPDNVCHDQIANARQGGNVPSFEPSPGQWNWDNDANQLWIAEAAYGRGADVFEGFVNSPPAWMLLNHCTAGGASEADNIDPAHYGDFATYIATIAQHFHDNFGFW